MSCPSGDDVIAFVDRTLGAVETETVAAHIEGCERCREVVLVVARDRRARGQDEATQAHGPHAHEHAHPGDDVLLPEGARVGRYTLGGVIGVGGMGVVYAGWDTQLERKVAVKLLRPDARHGPEVLRARLVREAQSMARLSHPNVIAVHEVGTHDGHVFLAMEHVDGGTLRGWLAAAPRSWREIVHAFVSAGRGLAAAHAAGLVHRDFKPDNVLVRSDGRFCVSDFGLARAFEDSDGQMDAAQLAQPLDGKLTRTGAVVGTPGYMAPEQARGFNLDGRTDQFSFCVALWEALFGTRPFPGDTMAERLEAVGRGPQRPSRRRVPSQVMRALERGLAADPAARFTSMGELLDALEARRLPLAWLALPLAALLAGGGLVLLRHARQTPQPVVRSVRRLTFTPGCESMPSFAPDGSTIVFAGEAADGDQQLYTLDVASGHTRRLTQGPGFNHYPAISPDGRRLAFVHDGDTPRELRVMAVDGTGTGARTVTQLMSGGKGEWRTPSRLDFFDVRADVTEREIDDPGAAPRIIKMPPRAIFTVAPFADGTLALDWNESEDLMGVGVLADGKLRVLLEHASMLDGGVVVAPSQRAIYYPRRNGAVHELVRIPLDGSEPQVLGGGVTPAYGVSIAADGKHLAFSTCTRTSHIARVGGDGSLTPLMPFGDWGDELPVALDGRRTLFASSRSGAQLVYMFDAETGEARPLPASGVGALGGASHDGRWFSFVGAPASPGIWIAPIDGSTPPRRLTDDTRDGAPAFTRDDAQVAYERDSRLWIVGVEGKNAHQLVSDRMTCPLTSAADDRIFFLARSTGSRRLMYTDARGTPAVAARAPGFDVTEGNVWAPVRSRDGQRVMLVRSGYQILEVQLDRPTPPTVRRVMRWLSAVGYAGDDHTPLGTVDYGEGDLWLADGYFP